VPGDPIAVVAAGGRAVRRLCNRAIVGGECAKATVMRAVVR
jgi:hypothetical protein